jgi:hypothetical protein
VQSLAISIWWSVEQMTLRMISASDSDKVNTTVEWQDRVKDVDRQSCISVPTVMLL